MHSHKLQALDGYVAQGAGASRGVTHTEPVHTRLSEAMAVSLCGYAPSMRVPHQLDGNDDQRLTTTPRVGSVREKIGVFERAAGVRQARTPSSLQLGASCRREVKGGSSPRGARPDPRHGGLAPTRHVFRHLVAVSTDSRTDESEDRLIRQ